MKVPGSRGQSAVSLAAGRSRRLLSRMINSPGISTLTGGPVSPATTGPEDPRGMPRDRFGRERVGRHADRVGLADREVVKPGDRDVARHPDAAVEQLEDQPECGVVLVADNAIGTMGEDLVGQFPVGFLAVEARWLLQDDGTPAGPRVEQRREIAGQSALVAARRRAGEESDPTPSLVQQVVGASEPAVEVIGRHEVVFERAGEAAEIPLDQDDGQPRLAARPEERLVLRGGLGLVSRRHEHDPRYAGLDRATGLSMEVGRARRLVELEPVDLEAYSLLPRDGRESRLAEREARLVPRLRACSAGPGRNARRAPPSAGAAKLPDRSTVRINPLSLSTWIARDAVTTETPCADATCRELGTFAPSPPRICSSIARAISRYFGSDAEDIRPPLEASREGLGARGEEERTSGPNSFQRVPQARVAGNSRAKPLSTPALPLVTRRPSPLAPNPSIRTRPALPGRTRS